MCFLDFIRFAPKIPGHGIERVKEVAGVLDEGGIYLVWAGLEVSLTAVWRQCGDTLPGVGALTWFQTAGWLPSCGDCSGLFLYDFHVTVDCEPQVSCMQYCTRFYEPRFGKYCQQGVELRLWSAAAVVIEPRRAVASSVVS